MGDSKKYISLDNLILYDENIKQVIDGNKLEEITTEDIDVIMNSNRIVDFGDLLFDDYDYAYFNIELNLQEGYEDSIVKDYGYQTYTLTPKLKDGTVYTVNNQNNWGCDYGINKKIELIHNNFVIDDTYYNIREYYKTKVVKGEASDFDMSEEKFAAYKILIRDMLEYGAAFQLRYGVNLDNLANENLSEDATPFTPVSSDITCLTVSGEAVDGVAFTGSATSFGTGIVRTIKISCEQDITDGFTVIVKMPDYETLTCNLTDLSKSGTTYVLQLKHPLSKFDEKITIELAKDNVVFQTHEYNFAAAAYKYNDVITPMAEVYKRAYVFGKSYENFISTP